MRRSWSTAALAGAGALTAGAVASAAVGVRRTAARLTAEPGVRAHERALPQATVRTVTTTDGAELHVTSFGPADAPPVLLQHGVTNQWWIWSGVVERLADDHHVVVPDMRGHGRSTVGEDGVTLRAVGRDLAELLHELDLRDVTTVGYSMGGMAVQRLLVDHPELSALRVARAVLIATSGSVPSLGLRDGGTVRTSAAVAPVYRLQAAVPALKPKYRPRPLPTALLGGANYGPRSTAAGVADLLAMHAAARPAVTHAAMRAMAAHDLRDALRGVRQPVLVIAGDQDVTVPLVHAERLVAALPAAELVVVPGARHGLVLEHPDVLAAHIRAHIASTGSPASA